MCSPSPSQGGGGFGPKLAPATPESGLEFVRIPWHQKLLFGSPKVAKVRIDVLPTRELTFRGSGGYQNCCILKHNSRKVKNASLGGTLYDFYDFQVLHGIPFCSRWLRPFGYLGPSRHQDERLGDLRAQKSAKVQPWYQKAHPKSVKPCPSY